MFFFMAASPRRAKHYDCKTFHQLSRLRTSWEHTLIYVIFRLDFPGSRPVLVLGSLSFLPGRRKVWDFQFHGDTGLGEPEPERLRIPKFHIFAPRHALPRYACHSHNRVERLIINNACTSAVESELNKHLNQSQTSTFLLHQPIRRQGFLQFFTARRVAPWTSPPTTLIKLSFDTNVINDFLSDYVQ